jgi:Tol biopolymer transport system component
MRSARQQRLAAGLVALAASALAAGASARPEGPGVRAASGPLNGRIAFQANVGRFPQVFTIEPDGTGLTQVTHVPSKDPGAENPIFSPDGATIAFDAASGKGVDVFTTTNGAAPAPLPLSVGEFNGDPAYSPDGTQISFDQDSGPSAPTVHGIFIANANGSGARRVTTGIPTTSAYDTQSQWSPDGKRLAFTRVKNEQQAAVFVVNVDGTGLRRLTAWSLDAANPDWSPDGRTILFNTYYDPHRGKFAEIYAMSPDGSHRALLTRTRPGVQSFAPAWSPDGSEIVFDRFTPIGLSNGRIDLFVMAASGKGAHRLTNIPRAVPFNPDWGTSP